VGRGVLVNSGAESQGVLFGLLVANKKGLDGEEVPAAPATAALLRLHFLTHIFLFIIAPDTANHNQPHFFHSFHSSLARSPTLKLPPIRSPETSSFADSHFLTLVCLLELSPKNGENLSKQH
jgi:hypothetical protein